MADICNLNMNKNEIVLINHQGLKLSSGIQIQSPSPSIGLAYIGAYIKKNGYDYTAIDACGEALSKVRRAVPGSDLLIQGLTNEDIIKKISNDVKIVGLTALFSHAWFLARDIAAEVKKNFPHSLIVVGGEHATAMVEDTLKHEFIDLVILGEGEETFLELINNVLRGENFKNISGIAYKNHKGDVVINERRKRNSTIDDIPYPDWDSWSISDYIEHLQVTGINIGRGIPILGSRGCPYECTFCSNKNMWTKRYIMRSPKGLVDEMQYMQSKYGVTSFHFMDATFLINNKKLLKFCEELVDRKLNVSYQLPVGTRCEAINEELVIALEKSGCQNFALAPESGSEEIRKIVKKQLDYSHFMKAVKLLCKSKMTIGCFFVIGFPEDNVKSMIESYKLILKLAFHGIDDITVSQFTPYPGSPYYDELTQKGVLDGNLEEFADVISFYTQGRRSYSETLSPNKIYYHMLAMFTVFYVVSFILRPWKPINNIFKYYSQGIERVRYVKFIAEFFYVRKKWFNNLLNTK